MSRTARLFLALQLPAAVARELDPWLARLRRLGPGLRVAPRDGLHLTLRFLGPVGAEREGEVREVASMVAVASPTFELAIFGLGVFPEGEAPKVIWAGIDDRALESARLATALSDGLAERGWPSESRVYRPHCTLARAPRGLRGRPRDEVEALVRQAAAAPPIPMSVETLSLLESVPVAGQPNRYPCRESWPLAGG